MHTEDTTCQPSIERDLSDRFQKVIIYLNYYFQKLCIVAKT